MDELEEEGGKWEISHILYGEQKGRNRRQVATVSPEHPRSMIRLLLTV